MKHDCINYRFSESGAIRDWEFCEPGKNGKQFTLAVAGKLTTNDDQSMVRAALRGLGLIQIVDIAVHDHLAKGRLVQLIHD